MHVLMTVDPLGGVLTYARQLTLELRERGVRTTWACMGGRLGAEQRRELGADTLHESELRLEWMDDPWPDVERAGEWLLDLERRARPDVVHLNGYAHAALPWRAPCMVVAHSCVCSWWRAVHGVPAPERYDRYRAAVRAGLSAAKVVVAPSRAMLDALEQEHGSVGPRQVIHNGLPSESGEVSKEPFVLGAGRVWDAAKNIAALAKASGALSWPIYVAGDVKSPEGHELRELGGVRLLGALRPPALASWMRRAAIFASPALYEPFGLAILEAALAGCALVLGDIPSLRELWSGAALFVEPRDTAGLGHALRRLSTEQSERVELGQRARQRALAYGARRMSAEYHDTYRQLLQSLAPRLELRA